MELGFWRDLALIWLAFLCFIGLSVPVVIAVFAVKGVHVVVDRTPRYLHMVQDVSRQARGHVNRAADVVVAPVVQSQSHWTRIRTRWQRLWARGR